MSDHTCESVDDCLAGLNEAQLEAAAHAGGPLIVLAGPGTGKTRVIVHRVAHLIAERGVEPEKILISTFTIKAARELRERLAHLIGPVKAERVHARTLHGLGYWLLQRFGDSIDVPPVGGMDGSANGGAGYGGRVRRSGLIDSAQSRRLMRSLILGHDLFGTERAAGVDAIIETANLYFEYFENHALSPTMTDRMTVKWGTACEAGMDLSGTRLDEPALEAAVARQARFEAIARLYRLYVEARRKRGWITYGDLLTLPIELLGSRPSVASIVRDDFRHVIFDEFQDVNEAQVEMLRLIAPPESCRSERRPSGQELVVVGDDDQAIYAFRGADDRAFWRFERIWQGCQRIALTENYRSRPRIIAVSNAIIDGATERFEPAKTIEFPRSKAAEPPGVLECVNLLDDKDDGEVIAAMVSRDRAVRRTQGGDEAGWRRYAVVAKSHSDLARIGEALLLEGIPSIRQKAGAAIDDEGVQMIMAWARLIVSPRESWNACRLLSSPPMSVEMSLIVGWLRQYRSATSRWEHSDSGGLEGSTDDPGTFPQWLARRDGEAGGIGEAPLGDAESAVRRFLRMHEEFTRAAAEEGASGVLLRIVRETGVIHADLIDQNRRAARVANVVTLLRFAHERQHRLPPPSGLKEFLEYFDDLSEGEQKLEQKSAESGIDETQDQGDDQTSDAVRLVTAHSSKGLEFDTVFVPRAGPLHSGYGGVKERVEADVPDELMDRSGGGLKGRERQMAEERRLFYVACTRAESRLVVLAKRNKKPSRTTNFFEEVVLNPKMKGVVTELNGQDVLLEASRATSGTDAEPEVDPLRRIEPELRVGRVMVRTSDVIRREAIGQARREIRLAAAGALTRVDVPGVNDSELDRAFQDLRLAAQRMSVVAAIEAGTTVPETVDMEDPMLRRLAEAAGKKAGTAADGKRAKEEEGLRAKLKAPLRLSYTIINDYLSCPRCWYVKHVLKFEGESRREQLHGTALHRAMEKFYRTVRERDAEGEGEGGVPSLAMLEAIARSEYMGLVGEAGTVRPEDLDQLLHQVRVVFVKLYDPAAQVLEIERSIRFPYRDANGVEHVMEAKVDRIDQITLEDGRAGYRIVDYKTGNAKKSITEPGKDDLQMGIYSMAVREMFESEVDGVAEYWVCATGQRGQVRMSEINYEKVRERIHEAITGILADKFERGKTCYGTCEILGP